MFDTTALLTPNAARAMMDAVVDAAPSANARHLGYAMAEAAREALVAAEADALLAIEHHAATIRRLSADLRVAKAENARLRGILKIRGIRA